MVEELLQIFIFTYNRALFLSRTLEQFSSGPFRGCSITVLDNHSTDETQVVCPQFRAKLPKLNAVRHPKNIGGLANYLRGVELASTEYTWIICDDDTYRFDQVADIIEAIDSQRADLISVGVEGHDLPGGYSGPLKEFALQHSFLLAHSFVPSLIFKTSLFTPDLIRKGYENVDTMFPHFPFLAAMADSGASLYVSKNKVIQKSTNVGYSTFRFLTGWAASCRKIRNPRLRRKAVSEVFGGGTFYKNLLYCVLTERAFRPQIFAGEYKELFFQSVLLNMVLGARILFFLPLIFGPDWLHRMLWEQYRKYRQKVGMPLPTYDEAR